MPSNLAPDSPDPDLAAQAPPANPETTDLPMTPGKPTLTANTPGTPGPALVASLADAGSLKGYRFGDFELQDELGRGGMGIVFRARQLSLERPVAVKMLLADHFRNPTALARFLGEAKAAAALDHRDIVKVYQIGECPLGPYFVMEYIDGQSLEAFLAKGPLSIADAVGLGISLAKAVDFAHSKGVIHRDLKPGNIMISRSRRPIIMDFGIAKVVGRDTAVTQQGIVVGTPSYMAPEQASEGRAAVGPTADIYSLGAILYATLTGRAPFQEDTALSTILKLVSSEMPVPVRRLRKDTPEELERICFKCLQKNPIDRYARAADLADDLRRFRAGTPTRASIPEIGGASSDWATLPTVVLAVQSTGKKIRLRGPVTLIGRSSECDVILRSSEVSKRHCQILLEDDQVIVEDLSSFNGTWVNGKPVDRCRLKEGDILKVAGHGFEVRMPKPKK
jgi:serine/threonine protein kinase